MKYICILLKIFILEKCLIILFFFSDKKEKVLIPSLDLAKNDSGSKIKQEKEKKITNIQSADLGIKIL